MRIEELIEELEEVKQEHGNLDVGCHGLKGRIQNVKVTNKGVTYCYVD